MKTIKLTILSSVAILASACGPIQSSPAKDYDQMRKQANPTTVEQAQNAQNANRAEIAKRLAEQEANRLENIRLQEEARQQLEAQQQEQNRKIPVSKGLIDIRTEGSLNFIESKVSKFLVKARVLQLKLNYELVFSGLPAGAKVESIDSQTKSVTWAPAAGVVDAGQESKSIKFEVALIAASKLSAADQRLFDAETTKETFEILVSKSKENPVVQKVSGLDGIVQEGSKVKFVVEVRDPGAQGTTAPKVTIKTDSASTRETVGVDGSAFISADPDQAPTTSAPGIWNFHFIYDTSTKAAPRPDKLGSGNRKSLAADEIPVRFKIEVLSPSERSTTTSKEFRLKYNTSGQAPKFSLVEGSSLTVEIGKVAVIDIKVESLIANGNLVTQAVAAQKALKLTLPGGDAAVRFRCTPDGKSPITCKLAWKVPCDESLVGSTHKLAMSATNAVGAIVVSGSTEQIITITKSNETNCTAANPTAGGN